METDIRSKYIATPHTIEYDDRDNHLLVKVSSNGKPLGAYLRTEPVLEQTFHPFMQNGKEYAFYSMEGTGMRIMHLPSCIDAHVGIKADETTFRPTNYLVPENGQIAFAVGYDHGEFVLQVLDISKISERKIEVKLQLKVEDPDADLEEIVQSLGPDFQRLDFTPKVRDLVSGP